MFDFVRKHMKVMQFLLFILIVPSFVFLGVQGYDRTQGQGETVAKVDGQPITQAEWDNAHRMEVDRLRQQMPQLDARLFDSPEARYATLERMVRDRVLRAAVRDGHLVVGDQRVARELENNQLIASLRGPDGKLDMDRYRAILSAQGLTPEIYENQIRGELATRQVLGGVQDSGYVAPAQAAVAINSFFDRREAQVVPFATADYKARVQPTEADLEAYYKAHPQQFQAPEQADIEYLVLDLPAVQQGITVNESDLQEYYKQNAERLAGQEERRASHILVTVPKDAPQAEKDKAKARAEELLAEVKKNPASFAEVARKNSQDPGSAAQGGDLDYFRRGAMTKPFEDAVFAMKDKGQISDVVESEFGYHIIQLTDVKAPKQRSFEEVRPELEKELRNQQAQRRYSEAADTFANSVYEQADSLKPTADRLKLEVRTARAVGRTPAPGAAPGPLTNARFLEALFAPESVERKRNTEAMEVGPNQMVSGRVLQYTPARTRPLDEVRDQVRERVVAEKAAELARKEGQEKLAAWKADAASATLPPAAPLSREDMQRVPRPVIEAALRTDPATLPAWVGVDLGPEGYTVVKVNKVLPREAPAAAQAQQEAGQYARAWSAAEAGAYYETLKNRFKAQINVPKPAPAAQQ